MKKELTTEMQRCLDIIKEYGSIVRYSGGFWQKPNDELKGELTPGLSGRSPEGGRYPLNSIGTNTINALVTRELIIATDHRNGVRGEFAVKYELKLEKSNAGLSGIQKAKDDYKKEFQATCPHPGWVTGTTEGSYCVRCGKPLIG